MRENPAKHKFKIFVGGVAPTKISVRWGRPREIQRPCRALLHPTLFFVGTVMEYTVVTLLKLFFLMRFLQVLP